jgi:hypothetical protein
MSESMVLGRRNTVLATVIGAVLASYAGSASALEFEFENGSRLNWNTTISVGSSWRAEDPSRWLYTRADGSALGMYSAPLIPGTPVGPKDGLAGNHAAGDGNLNYEKGDRFTTPFKLITDVEYKKDNWGALLRVKAWYDQALNEEEVRYGSQANEYNGVRRGLGPVQPAYRLCTAAESAAWNSSLNCMPVSPVGQNLWPRAKLKDDGFEAEQKFDNVYLLDAYVYGSFAVGSSDLQVRLGNQVVNWGESIFIQGVNQINPIDVPAARRAGAELKEILLPVWMAYANWGFNFGSVEAFYQLKWNNTSVDGCGTYFTATSTLISSDPGSCRVLTPLGQQLGAVSNGVLNPHLGALPYMGSAGLYVESVKGIEAGDSGQFGVAFRFPVDAIDTEIGLYAMNIHSRLPYTGSYGGTAPRDLPPAINAALRAQGIIGTDGYGDYWTAGTTTRWRAMFPALEANLERQLAALGINYDFQSTVGFWQYPEDIQIFGLSAATNLFGWSTSAEISYQTDVPVQINGNDVLVAGYQGIGPVRDYAREVSERPAGERRFDGFDQYDKTQAQVNVVKTFSNILGSQNMVIVGEVGGQWNSMPDYTKGGRRYGRGFMYGTGSGPDYAPGGSVQGQPTLPAILNGNWCSPTFVGSPVPLPNTSYNPHPIGCKNDGFITDMAWGYRLRVSMDYNNVFNSGVTMTPSVFWSQDVEGISMDPAFIEDREVLGLGMKFTYNKQYVFDLNWVDYANNNFDPLFDRDYYSASFSVTF